MRSLNFLFIFLICLALVFSSLENTATTTLQIINGVQIEAPLCIELILATGLGAFLLLTVDSLPPASPEGTATVTEVVAH